MLTLSRKKISIIILVILFPLTYFNINSTVRAEPFANGRVNWTPDVPGVGDTVTITYNTSASDAVLSPNSTQIFLIWGMYVPDNQLFSGKTYGAVAPSMGMWPVNSTLSPFNVVSYTAAKSPMINNTAVGLWEVSFILNDKPDYLVFYFIDQSSTKDDNNKNYWFIDTKLKTARIRVISPTMNIPKVTLPDSEVIVKVNASSTATSWAINLGGVGESLSPSVTPTFNADSDNLWKLVFSTPANLGLYDMKVSASIGGSTSTHTEINSLKIVKAIKTSYTFVVLADPQYHRDGSAGYKYRNEKTGIGNFTDLLKEINLINPEFILNLGDLTEWTDEVALLTYPKWLDLYLDNTPMVSIIGNHGDWEATATTPTAWEWGSGKGVWLEIIGPTHGTFWYGGHAFVLGDSSSRNYDTLPEEMTYLQNALQAVKSTATMKTLSMHHPLNDYGVTGEETIQGSSEVSQIKSWIKSAGLEAYFHGHTHQNKYDEEQGTKHIGTTEAVGDNPGYRLVTVENNEITKLSYGPAAVSSYSAPSWPINKIRTTYLGSNDGTETSTTAYFWNGLNHSLTDAHLRFKMDPNNDYEATGGEVVNSFIDNGLRVVDVNLDVNAETNHSVSLKIATATTQETNSTSAISSTTTEPTPATPLIFIFPAIIALVIFRKRRK